MRQRKFKVSFNFKLQTHNEKLELWAPRPLSSDYQFLNDVNMQSNALVVQENVDPVFKAPYLYAHFAPSTEPANLSFAVEATLTERQGGTKKPIDSAEKALYLQPRPHVPTDGIVKEMADEITHPHSTPIAKARAIYDWLCTHAERDPHQVGCGLGNVKDALLDRHVCGRCVDISSVFVALMRAASIPAREVFGVRVGPSSFAQKLGKTGVVSESQHCRCEFYLEEEGWIPCDPGDVTKVSLDEGLSLHSPRYLEIRDKLFNYWEPNWLAYNSGRDFQLSPSTGSLENYLMYPLALSLEERRNPYLPESFQYSIESIEL